MINKKSHRPAHRPSELTDELIDKAYDYLMGAWREAGDLIPSLSGLACYLGVCNKTIHNYKNNNDVFLHIVSRILTIQENRLLNGGLAGEFNASITKLLLCKHGYHDKAEFDLIANQPSPTIHIAFVSDKSESLVDKDVCSMSQL